MKQFRYRVVVEWCEDERSFVARVPAVPVFAARGHTPEEATEIARGAARAILEVMRQEGQPMPAPDLGPRPGIERHARASLPVETREPASSGSPLRQRISVTT